MKKLINNKKTKLFSLTLLLLIAIFSSAVTIAYFTDTTGALKNTFSIAEIKTHIKETNEKITDSLWQKSPTIVNDGPSAGLIRARITISPNLWTNDETDNKITLQKGSWATGKLTDLNNLNIPSQKGDAGNSNWIYGGDGYYYYKFPVKSGEPTTSLFDAVLIGSAVSENFDITIYQEAVVTTSNDFDTAIGIDTLISEFAAVN